MSCLACVKSRVLERSQRTWIDYVTQETEDYPEVCFGEVDW